MRKIVLLLFLLNVMYLNAQCLFNVQVNSLTDVRVINKDPKSFYKVVHSTANMAYEIAETAVRYRFPGDNIYGMYPINDFKYENYAWKPFGDSISKSNYSYDFHFSSIFFEYKDNHIVKNKKLIDEYLLTLNSKDTSDFLKRIDALYGLKAEWESFIQDLIQDSNVKGLYAEIDKYYGKLPSYMDLNALRLWLNDKTGKKYESVTLLTSPYMMDTHILCECKEKNKLIYISGLNFNRIVCDENFIPPFANNTDRFDCFHAFMRYYWGKEIISEDYCETFDLEMLITISYYLQFCKETMSKEEYEREKNATLCWYDYVFHKIPDLNLKENYISDFYNHFEKLYAKSPSKSIDYMIELMCRKYIKN